MKQFLLILITSLLSQYNFYAQSSGTFTGSFGNTSGFREHTLVAPANGTITFSGTVTNNAGSQTWGVAYINEYNVYNIGGDFKYDDNLIEFTPDCVFAGQTITLRIGTNTNNFSYSINYQFNTPKYSNDIEPNNTVATAILTQENVSYQGQFTGGSTNPNTVDIDGTDYYKFIVPRNGLLEFSLQRSGTGTWPFVTITDVTNNKVLQAATLENDALITYIKNNLIAGSEISIELQGMCSSYEMRWRVIPNTQGEIVSGNLAGVTEYCPSQNINNVNDTFNFTMPYDGQLVISGTSNTTVTVGTNTSTLDVSAGTAYTNFEGNQTGQNLIVIQNNENGNFSQASSGILKDTPIEIYAGLRLNSNQCVSSSYSIDYYFIPMTYANDIEPNDDYTQAIETFENTVYEGHGWFIPSDLKEEQEGNDWYKLTASRNGILNINANSDTVNGAGFQANYSVYRSNNNGFTAPSNGGYSLLTSSASGSSNGEMDSNVYCVKEGDIIYINVNGSNHSYQFSWSITEPTGFIDLEPNDTYNNAITINNGETKTGNIGYGLTLNTGGDPSNEDISDWYTFTMPAAGDVNISLSASGSINTLKTDFSILNSNGDLQNMPLNGNQTDGFSRSCLTAGTYFFRINLNSDSNSFLNGNGSCEDCCVTYAVTLNLSNLSTSQNDFEPNNTIVEADFVAANISHEGQLGAYTENGTDNSDVYELSADYNGDISVNFEEPLPQGNVSLQVFNGTSYSTVGTPNLDSNDMITSISYPCAAAGESYFLTLNANTCTSYSFNYTNTYYGDNNENEPNNVVDDAQLLGKFDNIFGQINYGAPQFVDVSDYFRLDITESAPLTIDFSIENNTSVTLFENGAEVYKVTQTASSGLINKLIFNNADASKTYHLQVLNSLSCSNYNLLGWEQEFTSNNDLEPNNNLNQAIAINFNEFYNGRLSYYSTNNDAQDYYSFTLNENDSVEFTLNAFEGLINTATLTLYNSRGNELLSITHDGINTAKQFTSNGIDLTAGDYYFIISGTSETGSYQVKATPQKALSISEIDSNEVFSIYPNPTKNILNLILNNQNNANASLYDINGRLILKRKLENKTSTIDLSSLNTGIYILQLETENTLQTKRIMKI